MESYLQHYGIFGMKWGVRRYQNEDGTLTEAGKQRYSSRQKDREYAEQYARSEIQKDQKQLKYWNSEVKKSKDTPATKEGIKKRINISDDDYEDYLREHKTPERIKKSIIAADQRNARIHRDRISDWQQKLDRLKNVEIDVAVSDKKYQKQIDDIFTDSEGLMFRGLDLYGLHSFMKDARKNSNKQIASKQERNLPTRVKQGPKNDPLNRIGTKTLSDRFNDALRDNPKLTYNKIYRDMKVNLNSDDPDDYKWAEDEWLKKHGY